MISIRRVYDPDPGDEAYRLLVDRLWPRGISREAIPWDEWFKEIAPSAELRKWFHHEPQKWEEFQIAYLAELQNNEEMLRKVKQLELAHHHLTLLYAARDRDHNHAIVLLRALMRINPKEVENTAANI